MHNFQYTMLSCQHIDRDQLLVDILYSSLRFFSASKMFFYYIRSDIGNKIRRVKLSIDSICGTVDASGCGAMTFYTRYGSDIQLC